MFHKSEDILIFMSKFQAQTIYKLKEHIFLDGTFYSVLKCSYQVITIRAHNIIEDIFHNMVYAIMNNKTTSSYIELLDNIKSYVYDKMENHSSDKQREPDTIYCDFKIAIITVIR